MSLLGNSTDLYVRKYSDVITAELQQVGSRLENTVMIEAEDMAERKSFRRGGAIEAPLEINARFTPITMGQATYENRIVSPVTIAKVVGIDDLDLKRGANPTSFVVEQVVNSMLRQKDAVIFNAFGASAAVERAGSTTTQAFLSGNTIAVNDNSFPGRITAVSGNTGLTEAKLRNALQLLMTNYVSPSDEEVFVIASAKQIANLQADITALGQSRVDFLSTTPLKIRGLVPSLDGYMGLHFIQYEGLADAANLSGGNQYAYVYSKSAVQLGMWGGLRVDVSPNKAMYGFPLQVYADMTLGAVRMDEKKMVRILCA